MSDLVIAGVDVREYTPVDRETDLVVVYAHSGGWVLGSLETADALVRRLSSLSGAKYVSVGYRLAPEHPHPAALDDLEAVLLATPGPVVLHGDSAGGNLCAVLAQRHPGRVRGQILVYPVTDWDPSRPSHREASPHGFLDAADMSWFWELYAPDPAVRTGPGCAPLRHIGPNPVPALVVTAGVDPLRDEGVAYASALRDAGGDVVHHHLEDCAHGFLSMLGRLDRADDTTALIASWVADLDTQGD
ncbi:alpha/beta hydrolase [Phycicoccus sp. DTK01]|uniref:alpha/beta hydrolase n=1 Tax=Phycicoccus sp. DTK01 TaxID=2785745 RepID=UPI001A8FBE06|nr:alpha/beta hydrolase [Phycicoccus sp. DTK01]